MYACSKKKVLILFFFLERLDLVRQNWFQSTGNRTRNRSVSILPLQNEKKQLFLQSENEKKANF
jgi:hypothetical protein